MADVWIKMRVDLDTDPQVIGIANRLGVDEATVVGYLLRAWGWADAHTTDGHAPSVTAAWLDRHIRRDGFAAALASVGWLEILTDGLRFPDFERHNGETAKKRALATDRQRRHRESVTQPSRDQRDTSVTEASTREEKRRSKDPPPSTNVDGGGESAAADPRAAKRNAIPDVDHQGVVDAWHEVLPELQPIEQWTDGRRTALRARWRELAAYDAKHGRPWPDSATGVARFAAYFRFVRESDFLMGRAPPGPGRRKAFAATIDYLLRAANMTRVIEGHYHDGGK